MLRHEFSDLEFDSDQTCKLAVEKEQVEYEILAANLELYLACDEAEVAAKLGQEVPHVLQQRGVEVGLMVTVGQVEKLDEIGVAKKRTDQRWPAAMRR